MDIEFSKKEEILIKEISSYLPSLSSEAKVCLIKMLHSCICKEFSKENKTCIGCYITRDMCREIQECWDNRYAEYVETLNKIINYSKNEDEKICLN